MVSKTVMSTFACVPFFKIVQNLIVYVGSLKPTQHVCFFIAKGTSRNKFANPISINSMIRGITPPIRLACRLRVKGYPIISSLNTVSGHVTRKSMHYEERLYI